MMQDGLMKKIFKTTKWEDLKGGTTPARERPTGADLEGKPFTEEWEHASVVGMSMFLVNTRPDIQFAVHQCTRFTHSPKNSHTHAAKRVIGHLKHTQENEKDRGLTFELGGNATPKTECHTDEDSVHEATASKHVTFIHLPGKPNPSDVLSKHWSHNSVWKGVLPIVVWSKDELNEKKAMLR